MRLDESYGFGDYGFFGLIGIMIAVTRVNLNE